MENIIYKNTVDIGEYNDLRELVGWDRVVERRAKIGIANSFLMTTAYDNDKLVGMARLISDGGYVFIIADVIVNPAYQGRGIGKHMITEIIEKIKSTLQPNEKVMVNLMSVKGKEGFYKKFGFIERPNEIRGAGMSQWLIG